jgi:YVTN family beta-propeller protein
VGAGGGSTASTADDTIYVTSNNARVTVIDPVSLEAVGTIAVGNYPIGVAVSRDDTVYVVNANSDSLSVIEPVSATVSSVSVPDEPQAVAVSRVSDDTLFISSRGSSQAITTLNARTLSGAASTSVGSNSTPHGLGLSMDDSAYIAVWPNEPRYFNSTTRAVTTLAALGTGYIGVAVTSDDTVFLANEVSGTVKSFPAASPGTIQTVSVSADPQGVAVGPNDMVYVANRGADQVTVIDPRTNQVDDSVNVGNGPYGIAVTRGGIAVTANQFESTASIVAAVSPSLVTTSAFAGTTGSLTLSGLPAGVTVDDTTVSSVAFGDETVVWTRTAGTNTFTGPIPSGSGSVPVVVALNGGNSASAGTFTYATTPPPPTPSNPPQSPSAVAGDGSASVTWVAPASSGSFAVSTYQVTSSPGGRSCLVAAPAMSCEVSGLTNGMTYTFTVRALNGAGWSPSSAPSNAVTPEVAPRPSVLISGSREGKRIEISGQATGFGMGGTLRPWTRFAGQSTFSEGAATILVSMDGSFEWGRKTGKRVSVYVQTPDASVRSNRVTIQAR